MIKKILFTGGGTAGHVTPNLAIAAVLSKKNFQMHYIGSKNGIEKQLLKSENNIKYYEISSGKLRRYFDLKNFTDIFNVVKGITEANKIIRTIKPDILFSKGGFVTVPVVIAAYINKVPVIVHESDMTCGLANKIALSFCKYICCSFSETLKNLPKNKAIFTGSIIRDEILKGNKSNGQKILNFDEKKPILMVIGGSTGSVIINNQIRKIINILLQKFNIVHLCGKNNVDRNLNKKGYLQFEYVQKDLADILACSDIIVSRAGSNSIFEFLALKKPALLIPLSKKASRGDQILNAQYFDSKGYCDMILEEQITQELLIQKVFNLYNNRENFVKKMQNNEYTDGLDKVVNLILKNIKK